LQAIGKPFTLWTAFARFYERHNSLDNARVIFDKATAVPFKYLDDLASVWCEYAEMELRHQNFKNALNLLRIATTVPDSYDRKQVILLTLIAKTLSLSLLRHVTHERDARITGPKDI
jgi:pre-mRNA-splicing factor SYF1